MKVIELLNKIANGEEVPKKIKYKDKIYQAEFNASSGKSYYCDDEDITLLLEVIDSVVQLNEEVEIIEEDKKIEHLLNGVDFENLKDNEKFDYLYEMETRIINYLEENK